MPAPLGPPPEARVPPPPPPNPQEPPSLLRERLLTATRALDSSLENGTAVSDAIFAARSLARAATATSFAPSSSFSSPSSAEESSRSRHALQCALGDAVELLNVASNASPASSNSSFAVAGAALLLVGCSAAASASAPAAVAAVAAAAEAATQALLRMADTHPPPAPPFFADKEAAGDAAAGVGRLAAAAAAAAGALPASSSAPQAPAALLLLAFARHRAAAAAAAAAVSPPVDSGDADDDGGSSFLLLPVSDAARMAASTVSPAALGPLLAEAATRARAEAAAAEGASSPAAAAAASFAVASSTFLLAGLAEGAGPRGPGSLPRELLDAIWTACGRAAAAATAANEVPGPRRFVERDAAAAAAVAVAEAFSSHAPPHPSGGAPLFPPQATSAMTAVLVSLVSDDKGGGPLDFSPLFDAAARRLPPEEAAARLRSPRGLARSLAPRAARALAVVAPSCPRAEAERALEGVAAAARRMHEGYAALASDSDSSADASGGASWLSSPALSASGVLRGALDAAFMSCVAALRALAVPAGALAGSGGGGGAPPQPLPPLPPPEPRAAAAALDALALVSFARPPATAIQAHSDLVSSLLEAVAAAAPAEGGGGGGGGGISHRPSPGAALVERLPPYEFFVSPCCSPSPSSSSSCSPPRWVADALLATRAHFFLLSLAPAARGMASRPRGKSNSGEEDEAEAEAAAAARKAASLALLFVGHPTSPALCGAAHGLAAALMDRGGPLSGSESGWSSDDAPPPSRRLLPPLLPGFLDRALDLRGGVRPHYPGLAVAVAAALRGCRSFGGEFGGGAAASAEAAALLVPRRLSAALREALLLMSSSSSSSSAADDASQQQRKLPALSPDSLSLVSALASALLSVDAGGFEDACAAAERALSPGPTELPAMGHAAAIPPSLPPSASSLLPLPLPLSAAAFDALGRAIGSTDDLLRKPALARWWARAAARVGVAAGR